MNGGIIYLLTFPSGKHYVGLTKQSLHRRWRRHCSQAKNGSIYPVHAAIRKYGENNVVVQQIDAADFHDGLANLERATISRLGTLRPGGYNLDNGGYIPTNTPEVRGKIRRTITGTKRSEGVKQATSKRVKLLWADPDFQSRMLKIRRQQCTTETRQKMSKSHRSKNGPLSGAERQRRYRERQRIKKELP